MAEKFATTGSQNLVSTLITAVTLHNIAAAPIKRAEVHVWTVGGLDVPADVGVEYVVQRFTVVPTGGASVTPALFDLDGPIAGFLSIENPTAEGTYTANEILWEQRIHGRGTFHWIAPPDFPYKIPSTTNAGIGWRGRHASNTDLFNATVNWVE